MTTRLNLAIQEHFESLSPSERKLASLLLEKADMLLAYTASDLATMAGVSKATAARLFRSLGYGDFNEVRLQAREERNLAPPFRAGVDAPPPPGRPGGTNTIAQHLHGESDSLARSFESMQGGTLRTAAEAIASAQRVWLLGLGMDDGLARFAAPQLARLRPDVFVLGSAGELWAEQISNATARDALLLILTQPRVRIVEQVMAHALATRVRCVGIVDVRNAGWARRVTHVLLPCFGARSEHAYSATAAVSMLHLLTQHVAQRLGERATQRQAAIAGLRRELDDG
jgi:DNA-binding MurR/RpiR family transcriptional regulator